MRKLNGPFKDIIPILVKMKKSIGYKYNNIYMYNELDNFLYKNNITKIKNTTEIFDIAISKEKNEYIKQRRYSALENINEIIKNMGLQEIRMKKLYFKSKGKFIPHILDTKDIKILFQTIDKLSKKENLKEKEIYRVFFRLLYSTGLRINEALNLTKAYYIREEGLLIIYKSKNNITRNVYLSKSMSKILNQYIDKFNIINEDDKLFDIPMNKIRYFFSKVVVSASLEPLRIHDLRHTFAVTALNKLLKNNEEYKALYMLQIYMGHTNIMSTEHYLRLTKKEINDIKRKELKLNTFIFEGEENERNK